MTAATSFPAIGSVWRNLKKDTLYRVLYTGTHSETGESLVVYQEAVGDHTINPNHVWCRPLLLWHLKFERVTEVTVNLTDGNQEKLELKALGSFVESNAGRILYGESSLPEEGEELF